MTRPFQPPTTSWIVFCGSLNSAYNDGEWPSFSEENVQGQSPQLNSLDSDFSGQGR